MQCWKCGSEIDDDSVFCTECGQEQGSGQTYDQNYEQETFECPRCGSSFDPEYGGCPVCGYEIRRKKRNKLLLVMIPVAAVMLLAVAGFAVGSILLKKNDSDQIPAASVPQSETSVPQTVGNVQPVTAETEDPGFWTDAIDAIRNTKLALTGTVEESSEGCFLNLDVPTAICVNDEAGQKQRLENIGQIKLNQASQSMQLIGHDKDVVTVTGMLFLRGQALEMNVYEVNVLQASVKEEEIHSYKILMEDCTWDEAFARCRSMGGYLVRFNSLEEFQYVTQMIDASGIEKGQFFIGARRDVGSDSYYLTDENNALMGTRLDNGYTDWLNSIWLEGEPSYRDTALGIEETCVTMFRYGDERRWVINDVPADLIAALETNKGKVGYICEMNN